VTKEKVQYLLSNARLDKSFWAEALVYTSHLMNCLSSTAVRGKTPLDIWSGGAARDYDFLRVFESPTYFSVKNGKINSRVKKFVFWGVDGIEFVGQEDISVFFAVFKG